MLELLYMLGFRGTLQTCKSVSKATQAATVQTQGLYK